ncbi:hypothetical protein JTB14_001803 [Gonioctena quinquepunctata]|nr:hypothetical protein JTB14_001803 [Gonioctena quinquepunctata]
MWKTGGVDGIGCEDFANGIQRFLLEIPNLHQQGDDEITRHDVSNPFTVKSSSSWVRPEEVSPIPRIENTKRKRQTTGSQALTESPILAEIKTRAETKRAAELRRAANRDKKNIQTVPYLQADSTGPRGEMEDVTKLFLISKLIVRVPQVNALREDIHSFKTRVAADLLENDQLKTVNIKLAGKIQSVERILEKCNLVIYGLKEEDTDLYEEILSLLLTKLDLDVKETDVFRLGRINAANKRPVVIGFISNKVRFEVLNGAKKLKGTGLGSFLQTIYKRTTLRRNI